MHTDFLLPPRQNAEQLSLLHLLLSEFQEDVEYQLEAFTQRSIDGHQQMAENWRRVADIEHRQGRQLPSDVSVQQQDWIRLTTHWCAAVEWLRLHENGASTILNTDIEDIDVGHPEVEPLWRVFIEQRHPQWLAQWGQVCSFTGWSDETEPRGQETPQTEPVMAEPKGANQSPFNDLPHHELGERYQLVVDDFFESPELDDEGYDREGNFQGENYAGEVDDEDVDDGYASARPDYVSPNETQSSDLKVPEKAVAPKSVPIIQFISKRLQPSFNRLVKKICDVFAFTPNQLTQLSPQNEDWRLLKGEELGVTLPEEDFETRAALNPIRAQKALLQVFEWADRMGVQDESRIEQEFKDAFITSHSPQMHDFDWHSSGATRIVAGEIEYEGGSEMPNDGFSFQSEARTERPFDRD